MKAHQFGRQGNGEFGGRNSCTVVGATRATTPAKSGRQVEEYSVASKVESSLWWAQHAPKAWGTHLIFPTPTTTSNQTRQWQPKHTQPSLVQVASQAGSRAHQLQGRAHSLEGVGLAHVAQLASGVHQTAVLEKGLKSVADAVKELCEIGRRQEERLRRLEENLSPLATLATSNVVVLPQQPMPGQQPPQPPQ
ncbi:hypothetical protein HPB52_002814 [Rhipicephalus sanguineus]|uniref:Uncharacterized protein n=1 Tax=Rhipicephalus sanguineus TaxID=34632 RepID=A0A9D4QAH7_RHISA|nr:hypothetical protein HPB52_002814 [Rhipicephalus sanguineus]